jgi:AbrB family looped-hinge helix DNA binding protein
MNTETKKTYLAEDIFEDIPGDPENCMMKIPPEVADQMGWKEGDTLKITVEEGRMTITKV